MGSMSESRVHCEICGAGFDEGEPLRYPRRGLGAQELVRPGLERCTHCQRRGCPRCLTVVEERADDYFIDLMLCEACLPEP